MKFGVVVFPGSNCDHDCFFAIKDVLRQPVEYLWHQSTAIKDIDCVVLPGGFSYGDYLRTGAIARFSPIMNAIVDFAGQGGLVLGICNGFQILLESGLLPGAMLRNTTTHFVCKYVYIRMNNESTPFTHGCNKGQVLQIPIAHNEGNYYIEEEELGELRRHNQIVFQYCDRDGEVNSASNPNGSIDNIAGIINRKGNVLGMMPHPERSCEALLGSYDGYFIFQSIVTWLKN